MKIFKLIILFYSLLFAMETIAKRGTKVIDVEFKSKVNNFGKIVVKLDGEIAETPQLLVKGDVVQIALKNIIVWPKIEKKLSLINDFDSTLMAYQFNKKISRIRAILPFSLKGRSSQVSVFLNGNEIEIDFPLLKSKKTKSEVKKKRVVKKKDETKYDEEYLKTLLKDVENNNFEKTKKKNEFKKIEVASDREKEDRVSTVLSGNEKKKSFSLVSYAGKFVAFLALVLALFYGVITLMKKGVIKKGKLGFLNSTKIVEVLSTTYIAPKKNLILVKAHQQVFLIGSSDKGIQLISEISDVAGLFKEGEKSISGENFDTNLTKADESDKEFKLKDILNGDGNSQIVENDHLSEIIDTNRNNENNKNKEKVKLSEQIKKKVKGLKSLQ